METHNTTAKTQKHTGLAQNTEVQWNTSQTARICQASLKTKA